MYKLCEKFEISFVEDVSNHYYSIRYLNLQ